MVFSSIPSYLDPLNWQQQPNQHQFLPPLSSHQHGASSIIRPADSIPSQAQTQVQADHATQTQVQKDQTQSQTQAQAQAQLALKCPRCESTNTKFCYYNNYNLSQPRHFCKTCRRYWTRGGALRNVPVGGGCRRSKKTKKSNSNNTTSVTTAPSKSPISISTNDKEYSTSAIHSTNYMMNMSSLQNMSRFGGQIGFQIEDYNGGGGGGGGVVMDPFQLHQQFPNFLNGNFESNVNFPFQSEIIEPQTSSRVASQIPSTSVKSEHNRGLNLLRSNISLSENNNHYNSSWTDYSGIASSSARHLM